MATARSEPRRRVSPLAADGRPPTADGSIPATGGDGSGSTRRGPSRPEDDDDSVRRVQASPLSAYHALTEDDRSPLDSMLKSDPECVRALPLAAVLAGCGRLLRQSEGDESTYALSRPVKRLDAFVSHSWRDSPFLKWLALSYHFYAPYALACGLAAAVSVFALEDGGGATLLLPARPAIVSVDGHAYSNSVGPTLAGSLAFVAALAFAGLAAPRHDVFLDKCCIDQNDDVRKSTGILAIPEVLRRSRHLLVLYERDYFERLWCVLELALFCGEGRAGGVRFLPVERAPAALFFFLSFGLLREASEWAAPGSAFAGWANALVIVASLALPCHFQLRSLEQKRKILADLRTFRLSAARCSDERDRAHVEQLIEARWRTRGGLAGFERSVHGGEIYDAVARPLGSSDGLLRYWDVVVATCGVLFFGLGMHAHNPHDASHAATTVFGVLVAMPAAFWLHAKLTSRAQDVRAPYWLRLPLATLTLAACIIAVSLVQFELGRAPCRAVVGYGCLRG